MKLFLFGFLLSFCSISISQDSPWEFGSKYGIHFVNNFSLEYGYGAINTEGYSSFEIGTELQIRKQFLLAPKISYTFYPHLFDILDPCIGIDALAFTNFENIKPIIRTKIGFHISALIELSYGYNWELSNQVDFNLAKHEISLVFRMAPWKAIE